MFIIFIVQDLHPLKGGYNCSIYVSNACNSWVFPPPFSALKCTSMFEEIALLLRGCYSYIRLIAYLGLFFLKTIWKEKSIHIPRRLLWLFFFNIYRDIYDYWSSFYTFCLLQFFYFIQFWSEKIFFFHNICLLLAPGIWKPIILSIESPLLGERDMYFLQN